MVTDADSGATCVGGPDGRAVALFRKGEGGKSGLHGEKAAGNARRGRPQGQRHRKQTARRFGARQG